MTHLLTICKIMRKGTQRGTTCKRGLSQSAWLVKLENDIPAKPWRRVYEDWNQLDKRGSWKVKDWAPVPLVIVIGSAIITLSDEQRDQLESHGCVPCAHIADYYDQAQRRRKSIGNNLLRRGSRALQRGVVMSAICVTGRGHRWAGGGHPRDVCIDCGAHPREDPTVNCNQPLEPGAVKIVPLSEERALAERDERVYGIGFLVDGKHVDPSRVVVLNSKLKGATDSVEEIIRDLVDLAHGEGIADPIIERGRAYLEKLT